MNNNNSQKIGAVIYTRRADRYQYSDLPNDDQKQRCLQFANKKGWQILRVFENNGVSGLDSKSLRKLTEYCIKNKGKVRRVIVSDFTRLSRKFSTFRSVMEILRLHNIPVYSVAESKPIDWLVEGILELSAKYEHNLTRERSLKLPSRK